MSKRWALFLLLTATAVAQVQEESREMTLRQVIDTALAQNPDVLLARLDQQKARAQVDVQRDPFIPKVFAGSGLAYTNGFPTSIEGSAPSVVQSRANMALFNRAQSYLVAQANEGVRGATVDVARHQQDVIYRVTLLFLEAEQLERSVEAARRQVESLVRVRDLTSQRVTEGRQLPIENRKAAVAVMRGNQSVENLSDSLLDTESSLAQALGMAPGLRVRPAPGEPPQFEVPGSEAASIEQALASNNELKSLQSNIQAKLLESKSYQAERLPRINLVAQYSLLARFNNYDKFFNAFQANNVELGASFEIPILVGHASTAEISLAQADIAKLKIEVARTRSRIAGDLRSAYQNLHRTESARELARADLDLAREELTVDLAQMDEGRLPLAVVEAARAAENEKWLTYYDSQRAEEVARLDILRLTGTIEAALR